MSLLFRDGQRNGKHGKGSEFQPPFSERNGTGTQNKIGFCKIPLRNFYIFFEQLKLKFNCFDWKVFALLE